MYEGTLGILQENRTNALRVQWQECKPWKAYDIVHPSSAKHYVVRSEDDASLEVKDINVKTKENYPIEWYGKNELAKSVPESCEELDEINPTVSLYLIKR